MSSAAYILWFMSCKINIEKKKNLAEGIHKTKCKDCNCFLEYVSVKGNFIKYKCLSCNKDYLNKLDEELRKEI